MASIAEKIRDDITVAQTAVSDIKSKKVQLLVDGGMMAEVSDNGDLRLNDAWVPLKNALALAQFITENYSEKL